MSNLFLLEFRLLAREPAAWVLSILFAGMLAYGICNGAAVVERKSKAAVMLQESADDFQNRLQAALNQNDPRMAGRLIFAVVRQGALALLPDAPLPLLATGQSDLAPGHEKVVLWTMNTPSDTRAELDNPSHLLAGRFDLAFVLVWLFPLFLLAFLFDLMAGDRDSGTLRLALSQGMSPSGWLHRRALVRALPVMTLALLAVFVAATFGDAAISPARLGFAIAAVAVYGVFWTCLAMAVNSVARSAAGSATALGAAWVAFVLVAPTLLNVAVVSMHPTPSRPELVAEGRRASSEAQKRGQELIDTFYQDHPELAPPNKRANNYTWHLTVQEETGRAIDPVRKKFAEQLAQQQTAVGRWRFVSPAIAMQEALTDLAGTGYWRYRAFREQVNGFKKTIAEFYAPKIHKSEPLSLEDLSRMPKFTFAEEPDAAWMQRVGIGIAGVGALAALLGLWTWSRLRPSRMGVMAG